MMIIQIMATVLVIIIWRNYTENKKLTRVGVNNKRKKNLNNNDNVNDKDENCNK